MRNYKISFGIICAVALTLSVAACKQKPKVNHDYDNIKGTYFSVFQFIQDQFKTYHGQPYTFVKTVIENGKKDSTMENINTIDWGTVLQPFIAADIGDRNFLGRYNFNMFEDATTQTRNFFYEAKDEDLLTRRLQIAADPVTNKVMSIYIETSKKTSWGELDQKLYYQPLRYIQIQQFEKKKIGSGKDVRVEYKFL